MKTAILALALITGLFQQSDMTISEQTAQMIKSMPQVVSTLEIQGDFYSEHLLNKYSLIGVSNDGDILASTGKDGINTEEPQGSEPVPHLTTSWVDARNVTHTVVTPIASSTAAGVQRAFELHEKLVELLQRAHPPKPA